MKKLEILVVVLLCQFTTNSYSNEEKEKFKLGQFLFFDKVLSGNKNISCATCHHPTLFSTDSLALGLGEGAKGLGTKRIETEIHILEERVPRNAPALFNVGSKHITKYFHDGRVEHNADYPSGFKTPAFKNLPNGLNSLLAAQSIFPLTSTTEMAGQDFENKISLDAEINNFRGVWNKVTARIIAIDEYVDLFKSSFPDKIKHKRDISINDIGNALAFFQKNAFESLDSPYDKYLKGDEAALSSDQKKGLKIFRGKGLCINCHSGILQTDNKFHSIALPPVGPGKSVGYNANDDFGRQLVTSKRSDKYKFKTPSLRNVTLTAPYGHNGAYNDLRKIINHHLNPKKSLFEYDFGVEVWLPFVKEAHDSVVLTNKYVLTEISNSSSINEINLTDAEVHLVIEFLKSLTDSKSLNMKYLIPLRVPSKLTLEN